MITLKRVILLLVAVSSLMHISWYSTYWLPESQATLSDDPVLWLVATPGAPAIGVLYISFELLSAVIPVGELGRNASYCTKIVCVDSFVSIPTFPTFVALALAAIPFNTLLWVTVFRWSGEGVSVISQMFRRKGA
jgi:hypothetical protein